VHRRFLRAADGSVSFTGEAADMPAFDEERFLPVEVKAGSLVLLHGANVHLSKENSSPLSRHAYAVHFVEGGPGYEWQTDNWLQRPADMPFEPLLPEQPAAAPAAAAPAARQPAYAHTRGSAPRVAAARPAAAPASGVVRSARPY
jgi:phytanoyl-CoA hydroxylase